MSKPYEGERITVTFDARRCLHAAECVKGLPRVFDTKRKPWISPDDAAPAEVAEVVRRCPSGALHYEMEGAAAESPQRPTMVSTEDRGTIWLRGDLELSAAGEQLAETRAALCGCGRSENRPFCDNACSTT